MDGILTQTEHMNPGCCRPLLGQLVVGFIVIAQMNQMYPGILNQMHTCNQLPETFERTVFGIGQAYDLKSIVRNALDRLGVSESILHPVDICKVWEFTVILAGEINLDSCSLMSWVAHIM